jgi:serine/threonine protein kinase/Leucine-rich repeat (LRR) protein
MIAFSCSHCGMKFQVKTQFAGRSSRCPTCKQPLVVPPPNCTEEPVAAGEIKGTSSSLTMAGVAAHVLLAPAASGPAAEQKQVRDLLARRTSKGERYIVEREIARGGMGAVLRAVDCDIRREVAIKYLLDQSDMKKKARFVEEAQITGQLEHPNIVPIHELGFDAQQRLFFSMKMVKGQSLAQVLDDLRQRPHSAERAYPLGRLLTLFVNVCNALAYAHARGVVHRDLKPANIMIGDFGAVYVMDWGLAKVLGQEAGSRSPESGVRLQESAIRNPQSAISTSRQPEADLTQEGAVLGTPVYMPPEQATGRVDAVDPRSDIYSLGAVLYEMLTLQPPVDRQGDYVAVLLRVAQGEIAPPEQRAPERARKGKIPKELAAIAMKAMARDPKQRYPSADHLRQDIERFLDGRSVSARPDSTREMVWKLVKRNKLASAFTAVLAVVLLWSSWANYRARQATEQAQKDYQDQVRKSVPAFLEAARLYVERRDLDQALKQLDIVLVADKDNHEARLLRGQILVVRKEFASAARELADYLKLRPGDTRTKALADLCQSARPDEVATFNAVADIFRDQKAGDALVALAYQHAGGSMEGRRKMLPVYQKRIETAWPGQGARLWLDTQSGEFRLSFENYRKVTDLGPLKDIPLSVLDLSRCEFVRDLGPLQGMPLKTLYLSFCVQVRDLRPLAGLPLTTLSLHSCGQVKDLTPLAGMPLTSLNLQSCDVTDLKPLAGMKLVTLNLYGCSQVKDLTPLASMPLTELTLDNCQQIKDLTALQGMPLSTLSINTCSEVRSLAPLRGLSKLSRLDMGRCTQVDDLRPLQGLPLTRLYLLESPKIHDLAPLKGMNLTWLSLNGCNQVKDIRPLAGMKLAYLDLAGCTQVKDLSPLEGMPLTTLSLSGCLVSDLKLLRGMKLMGLDVSHCAGVKDLTPLAGMPLTALTIGRTPVQDLTPLAGLKLTSLSLEGCVQVRDLTPLRGMPLTDLRLFGCEQVHDLTPLQGMNLFWLSLTPRHVTQGIEVLRPMKTIKYIRLSDQKEGMSLDEFWRRYEAGEFNK